MKNYTNKYFRKHLPECPKCRMDAGRRMVSDTVPERYFVICEACGFKVGPYANQSAASRKWAEWKEEK